MFESLKPEAKNIVPNVSVPATVRYAINKEAEVAGITYLEAVQRMYKVGLLVLRLWNNDEKVIIRDREGNERELTP